MLATSETVRGLSAAFPGEPKGETPVAVRKPLGPLLDLAVLGLVPETVVR